MQCTPSAICLHSSSVHGTGALMLAWKRTFPTSFVLLSSARLNCEVARTVSVLRLVSSTQESCRAPLALTARASLHRCTATCDAQRLTPIEPLAAAVSRALIWREASCCLWSHRHDKESLKILAVWVCSMNQSAAQHEPLQREPDSI